MAVIAGVAVLLMILFGALVVAWIGLRHHERAMPHVYLAGVEVSGMTALEMGDLLDEQLAGLPCQQITVYIGNTSYELSAAEIGRGWDRDTAIAEAMAARRGDDGEASPLELIAALFGSQHVGVEVVPYEPGALAAAAERVADEHHRDPSDAAARVSEDAFTVQRASNGRDAEPQAIVDAFAILDDDLERCSVQADEDVLDPAITTEEATYAAQQATLMSRELALVDGDESWSISADTLHDALSFEHDLEAGTVSVTVDQAALEAAVAALADKIDREVNDAGFEIKGHAITGTTGGAVGRKLDIAATVETLQQALQQRSTGAEVPTVGIVAERTQPAISSELAEETLADLAMIGSWTTNFVPNDGNGFGANIHIGARDLDGYVLAPGAQLDFWDAIGPVTVERGYTYGGVIIDGRSVAGGAIGGGICSTSTTLFNAALRAGLQIDSRDNHAYYIERYPVGLDATVWATDDAEQSMVFTNDTDYPIIIRGYSDDPDSVTFELWSKPDGRKVALSDAVISNRQPASDTVEETTALAPGVEQRVEAPHEGFDAVVTRTVTGSDGKVLHNDTFNSDYKRVDGVLLRGADA